MYLYFSKMSNIEHQVVIKFFTWKKLNATKTSKELNNVYKDSAPSYRTVARWTAELKNAERCFEDALRMGRPSIITTDGDIDAVERTVMRDRQVSVHRVTHELDISKTTIHEMMDNQLSMKKICTR